MATADTAKVALIAAIADTLADNSEADDGDKILASTGYAMEAIDTVLREGDLARLVREGWFTADMIPAPAT